jgi:ABC-type nitrate/sulfonate/bicarbonate transport system substrate-binding protein
MVSRKDALAAVAAGLAATAMPSVARGATQALSVGQIGTSVAFFPLYVAQNLGYFKAAGLDVTLTALQSGTLVGTAVTSNSVDIGCSVITDVFALLKANRPVKIVGSLVNGYYVDIVMNDQFYDATKGITRASKLSDKILALKGKNIGITGPGSGNQALVDYLFLQQNLDPRRDVQLVNVGVDQGSILQAMKTGRIDGVSFAWPLAFIAEAQNIGKPLIMPALGDVPTMRDQIQGVIYVKPDLLDKRGDAVVAFVHAVGKAEALIHRDSTRAKALLKQYTPALSDSAADALFAAYLSVLPNEPSIPANNYEKSLQFHRLTGFAGPSGNGYSDVVSAPTIIKALHA